MAIPEVEISIAPDGKVTIRVLNVEGQKCVDLAQFLNQLGEVEVDDKTPDYYKQPKQGVNINI